MNADGRLRFAVESLVDNAIEHDPIETPTVRIRVLILTVVPDSMETPLLHESGKQVASRVNKTMYLGTDVHKRYAGAQAAPEATSNYYRIHDTLSEHLDRCVPVIVTTGSGDHR